MGLNRGPRILRLDTAVLDHLYVEAYPAVFNLGEIISVLPPVLSSDIGAALDKVADSDAKTPKKVGLLSDF